MGQNFIKLYAHIVFTTYNREASIAEEDLPALFKLIGTIIKKSDNIALAVGGTTNHIHALTTFKASEPLSGLVRNIKGGSSFWLKTIGERYKTFSWQSNYGALSVSSSSLDQIIGYINKQRQHHAKVSLEAELQKWDKVVEQEEKKHPL
jgi:putative transposase